MAKVIVEGLFDVKIDEGVATPPVSQKCENAIIYSGERDKVIAILMKEFLHNSTIVDIADYKSYMCRNAYAIGCGASKGLEKFPDNVTKFVGNEFKDTYRKVIDWLENRKSM
jgi:uncharacterized protein (UPF0254 family)